MASTAFVFVSRVVCPLVIIHLQDLNALAARYFCYESSRLTHRGKINKRKYDDEQNVARVEASKTGRVEDVKDDGYSLVSRELPGVCLKCLQPFGDTVRRIADSYICDAYSKSGDSPQIKVLQPIGSGRLSLGIRTLTSKFRKALSKRRSSSSKLSDKNNRSLDGKRSSGNKNRSLDTKQYSSDKPQNSDSNNRKPDKKPYLDGNNRNSGSKRYADNKNRKFFNPEALLKCMLKAVEISLPPFVISQISSRSLLSKIGGIFGMRFAEEPFGFAISPNLLDIFLEEAYLCFELFEQDRNRLIFDQEDVLTRKAVEHMKLQPMGALAVAATEALAEPISISYNMNREPPHYYVVDNPGGLAGALGVAAVEVNKAAAASEPAEGLDWLNGSGSNNNQAPTVGNWLSRTLRQPANRNGASTASTQVRSNELGKLLNCVLNAARTSLGLPSVADLALGILKDQISNIPLVAEFFRRRLSEEDSDSPKESSAPIAPSVLQTFIKEAKPCFRVFKIDEDGKLVWDHEVIENTAIEAFRISPLGALTLGSAEAIAENVTAKKGGDGKVGYEYDRIGLATGLGKAFFRRPPKLVAS